MAKKSEEDGPPKKTWLDSDERKAAIESLPEEERAAADDWDKQTYHKSKIAKAREEYEKKTTKPPDKKGERRWGE